jgi:hypothetical protein
MAIQTGFDFGTDTLMVAPLQFYFKNLDGMTQTMGPLKGIARWQLEAAGLMSRRTQAYLEIPSRLSRCRTPQDLLKEQTRFWQVALHQYSESSRRMMDAWMQAMTPAGFGQSTGAARRERDYITFEEPKANGADRRGRQAA